MKNSSDTIGNRTRDLLTCSAVPQPTAPPRDPFIYGTHEIFSEIARIFRLCVRDLRYLL